MSALQYAHFLSGFRQISRIGQAIVPAADNNRVVVLPIRMTPV